MINRLEDLLIRHEGLKNKPYRCSADALTIGVGRNLESNGISYDEAIFLLRNDINRTIIELCQFEWFSDLEGARRDAIISICFNLGLPRFKTFVKAIAALNARDYTLASDEFMDSKWRRQVGRRAVELCAMLEENEYPSI